jgi:hypothetical protein
VLIWGGTLGALVAFDVWAAYNDIEGDSLSEVTRAALRTDTPEGRALFVLGWASLSAWFVPHICRRVTADLTQE